MEEPEKHEMFHFDDFQAGFKFKLPRNEAGAQSKTILPKS